MGKAFQGREHRFWVLALVMAVLVLVVGASWGRPAEAGFIYKAPGGSGTTLPGRGGSSVALSAEPKTAAGPAAKPGPGCGFSSAVALRGRVPVTDPDGSLQTFWLVCGEHLSDALARWGVEHGVLVLNPDRTAEDEPAGGWRITVDYRFLARDFLAALAQLRDRFRWPSPKPVFHYDEANRVLLIRQEGAVR